MRHRQPPITVVVPVHNSADYLSRSLGAIAASDLPRDAWELIVVDDGSADDSALVAARHADTVVKLSSRPRGPAYARNRGVELARGEIIVVVDADVCVRPDSLRRLAESLTADATIGAVHGAYDSADRIGGLVTNFRNLRHCHLQQQAAGEVDYFWAACGAVRRSVLEQVGAFDEWHYWRPQAEGAELGQRIRGAGYRILLEPSIKATHLKEWTLKTSITTDLLNHGVPWMRLMLQGRNVGRMRAPSLSLREKITAALGCTLVAAVFLNFAIPSEVLRLVALGAGLAVLIGAAPLFQFFATERDPLFAICCLPLQALHYVTAGLSVVLAWTLHQTIGEPKRDVTDDAFAEIGLETWPPIPRRLPADAWRFPPEKS
jgi:GT2 family glycosyltransferase